MMIRQRATRNIGRAVALSLLMTLLAATVSFAQDSPRATVRIEQPDLMVKTRDISFRPENPRPGEDVNFEIAVLNLGRAGTQARILCELMATDRTEDRVAARKEFRAAIAIKRSQVVHWKVKMPQGRRVQLVVTARVESGAADANESNNRAVVTVSGESSGTAPQARVTVTPPSLPDLTIVSGEIFIDPSNPSTGQEVFVTAMVRNIGTVDATSARANFYLYVDGRLVSSQIVSGSVSKGGSQAFCFVSACLVPEKY